MKEELRKCKRHLAEKGVLGNKGKVSQSAATLNLPQEPFTHKISLAVVFQIAQVGNDVEARKFLRVLDTDKDLKGIIDVTSSK